MSKNQAVKKVSHATVEPISRTGEEYEYEEFVEGNKIVLASTSEHRNIVWAKVCTLLKALDTI